MGSQFYMIFLLSAQYLVSASLWLCGLSALAHSHIVPPHFAVSQVRQDAPGFQVKVALAPPGTGDLPATSRRAELQLFAELRDPESGETIQNQRKLAVVLAR
jgi:hypothetical protein